MKNKSSIFLLLGCWDYEGDVVLGAYSSLKKANCALDAYKAKVDADRVNNRYENTAYDDYVINECEVNAEVWSFEKLQHNMKQDIDQKFTVTWKSPTQRNRKTVMFRKQSDAVEFYKEKQDENKSPALYITETITSTRLLKLNTLVEH